MKERSLHRAFVVAVALIALLGCKKKSTAGETAEAGPSSPSTQESSPVPDHVIQSKDEVCNLLTSAEVSAELKMPIGFARQRAIALDAPTECIYPAGDGADATGVALRLSFQRERLNAGAGFAHALLEVCGHDAQQSVPSLGDEAVLCSKLVVRKGDTFFVLSRLDGAPAVQWADSAKRLARKAVARLP